MQHVSLGYASCPFLSVLLERPTQCQSSTVYIVIALSMGYIPRGCPGRRLIRNGSYDFPRPKEGLLPEVTTDQRQMLSDMLQGTQGDTTQRGSC